MTEHNTSESDSTTPGFGGVVIPAALLAAAFSLLVMIFGPRFLPALSPSAGVPVVTFDVIKYTNSQRAVASAFVKQGSQQREATELLSNLSERTRKAIEKAAGAGTLVVIKQSVVQGQTRDITDAVLQELGLPVEVPTEDATSYSLDVAPTLLSTLVGNKQAPSAAPTNKMPVPEGQDVLP